MHFRNVLLELVQDAIRFQKLPQMIRIITSRHSLGKHKMPVNEQKNTSKQLFSIMQTAVAPRAIKQTQLFMKRNEKYLRNILTIILRKIKRVVKFILLFLWNGNKLTMFTMAKTLELPHTMNTQLQEQLSKLITYWDDKKPTDIRQTL